MNNYDELIEILTTKHAFKGEILFNESLKNKTTFKVGGNAELFIKPENYNSFQTLLDLLIFYDFKFFILGGGSNLVFTDDIFHGVIISTEAFSEVDFFPPEDLPDELKNFSLKNDQVLVTCFSGSSIASLVNFCTENNISGVEQFAGLPGTVGGALFMNARCFEKSISDFLLFSSYMDYSGPKVKLKKLIYRPEDWEYKKSPFQNNKSFITTATFLLTQKSESEHNIIESDCKKYINERIIKGHFKYPSAGSVFKNNHDFGKPSGKIIDEAGLKGFSIGGAQVAPFHGNFIINVNNAKSDDIKQLVQYIQKIVYEKFTFKLETEILFVDN